MVSSSTPSPSIARPSQDLLEIGSMNRVNRTNSTRSAPVLDPGGSDQHCRGRDGSRWRALRRSRASPSGSQGCNVRGLESRCRSAACPEGSVENGLLRKYTHRICCKCSIGHLYRSPFRHPFSTPPGRDWGGFRNDAGDGPHTFGGSRSDVHVRRWVANASRRHGSGCT